jgi:hypothetical protein
MQTYLGKLPNSKNKEKGLNFKMENIVYLKDKKRGFN